MINTITRGDCRKLTNDIPDQSIDLIFTDPPYKREYLYLYDWLADVAPRILKPSGFMLAYAGTYWKSTVIKSLERTMEYYFDFILVNGGNSPIAWQRKIISRHKSILVYRLHGHDAHPRTNVLSLWVGGGQDKRYHTWGQDESSARYYIDCFSKRGDLIFDPFCGGGTTPAVCKLTGRNFISFEIDPRAYSIAKDRLKAVQLMLEPDIFDHPDLLVNS